MGSTFGPYFRYLYDDTLELPITEIVLIGINLFSPTVSPQSGLHGVEGRMAGLSVRPLNEIAHFIDSRKPARGCDIV